MTTTQDQRTTGGTGTIAGLQVLSVTSDEYSSTMARIRIDAGSLSLPELRERMLAACVEAAQFSFVSDATPKLDFDKGAWLTVTFTRGSVADPDRQRLTEWADPEYVTETTEFGGSVTRDGGHYTGTEFTLRVSGSGHPVGGSAVDVVTAVPGVEPGVQRLDRHSIAFTVMEPDKDAALAVAAAVAEALRVYVPQPITYHEPDPTKASNPHYNQDPKARLAALHAASGTDDQSGGEPRL
jgi:hypothetical protein